MGKHHWIYTITTSCPSNLLIPDVKLLPIPPEHILIAIANCAYDIKSGLGSALQVKTALLA